MRPQTVGIEPQLPAPAEQHAEHDDPAGDIRDDRADRNPAESHHWQSEPAARERAAASHVDQIDDDQRDGRRNRIARPARRQAPAAYINTLNAAERLRIRM